MAKEIGFKNGKILNFQGFVTSNSDRSYCITLSITHRPLPTGQMSLKSKTLFVDGRTFETHFIRSTQQSQPKNSWHTWNCDLTYNIPWDFWCQCEQGVTLSPFLHCIHSSAARIGNLPSSAETYVYHTTTAIFTATI